VSKVSIIIPTYNRAAWLPKAIASAKATGAEVIVVDNGSTDETPEVCRTTEGIRHIRLDPNVRQARARNAGIRESTGEFLLFLDDDDQLLPGVLDDQVRLLESDPELGFVYGPVLLGDSQNCLPTGEMKPAQCTSGDLFWLLLEGNFITIPSALMRRKLVEEVGLFDPEVVGAEDWMLLIRLAERHAVGVVEKPVAICRTFTRTSGQTSSNCAAMCDAAARAQAKALRLPRALGAPEQKRREVRRRFLDGLSWMLVDDSIAAISEGNYRAALASYGTALRLNPTRAARPYTLKLLLAETRLRRAGPSAKRRI